MDTKRDKDNLENFFKKGKFFEKRILITGGTGFIGYHVAKKCIDMGWEVVSLSKGKPNSIRTIKK